MSDSAGGDGRFSRHYPAGIPHHGPGPLAAIGSGGALGTVARYGVERAVIPDMVGFAWATFAVNVAGSFILAAFAVLVARRFPEDRWLRPFVAVGFCGGFTTFSTFALQIDQRVRHGHLGSASVYLVASLTVGIGAAVLGSAVARRGLGSASMGSDLTDPDLLAEDDPPHRGDGSSDR